MSVPGFHRLSTAFPFRDSTAFPVFAWSSGCPMGPVKAGHSDVHGGFWSVRSSSRPPESDPAPLPWHGGAGIFFTWKPVDLQSGSSTAALRAQATPARQTMRMTVHLPCFRTISTVQSTSSWLDNGSVAVLSRQRKDEKEDARTRRSRRRNPYRNGEIVVCCREVQVIVESDDTLMQELKRQPQRGD
ncbi:hypothetical protein HPB51_021620 [Rhipicephalus microplus]|uniref:Uncharacterized protein n=1 Tax=Rhipicephalus microplus TaxID=6941 RepID=A0A9J6EV53_RHIMP|nr:hypothetical protein HPB51_021620 [Rhipicephalus microplus]